MTNRREFLQITMAVSVLPVTGYAGGMLAAEPFANSLQADMVIFDRRYPDSRRFADSLRRGSTMESHGIDGDITALWYRHLDRRWQSRPLVLAGMTTESPLFCLEQLAWPLGMRLVYRGEHRSGPGRVDTHDDRLVSWLIAPARRA